MPALPGPQNFSQGLDFCLFAVDTYRAVRHSNPIVLASSGLKYIALSAIDGVRVLRPYLFATARRIKTSQRSKPLKPRGSQEKDD